MDNNEDQLQDSYSSKEGRDLIRQLNKSQEIKKWDNWFLYGIVIVILVLVMTLDLVK